MSRIDDLIRDLCPDGVEYKPLGEVARYSPQKVSAEDINSTTFVGVDNLLSQKRGRVNATHTPNTSTLTAYHPGSILLGNIRPYLKKVWLADRSGGCSGDVLAIEIKCQYSKLLESRFLYYIISGDPFFAFNQQNAKGSKMPRGDKEVILRYPIPVPPLEVQQEITRTLDQFTNLGAALEAELEVRDRQYIYYRTQLLKLPKDPAIHWVPLGSVSEIRSGWGFPKNKQGNTTGEIPFYKVSDMNLRGNEVTMRSASNYIDISTAEQLKTKPAPAGTTIFPKIGATLRTNKKRILCHTSAYDNNIMGLIPTPQINPRFLYYWMQEVDLTAIANDSGAVPSIRKSDMENMPFPLLPINEQHYIVSILDKFDSFVNDLTSGLPAEIEARRKQYEYYRDRLLTFPEKK